MRKYLTVATAGENEIEIKKSRFITQIKRVETEEDAKEFIARIKKEHYKANHNCSAYIIGESMEIQRYSDDGEPSGTAGMPMLDVLKKNELVNLVVVVTRYFGGTKLGAGGLIRAYSTATSEAIEHIGRVEGKLQKELILELDYSQVDTFEKFMREHVDYSKGEIEYGANVSASVFADAEAVETLQDELIETFNGKISITEGDEKIVEVPYQKISSRRIIIN
jgi:uncharacterized YigZ family protein